MWHTWARGEVHTEFLWGKVREREHLEDLGVDGRIILRHMFRKWDGDMYCIDLAHDGEIWWADVNTVTNVYILLTVHLSTMIVFFFSFFY